MTQFFVHDWELLDIARHNRRVDWHLRFDIATDGYVYTSFATWSIHRPN